MMSPMSRPDGPGEQGTLNMPPVVARIQNQTEDHKTPICVLMVGMAGSGKTTLMAQLQESTYPDEDEEVEEGAGDEEKEESQAEKTEKDATDSNVEDKGAKQSEGENDGKSKAAESQTPALSPAGTKQPAYCVNLDPATLDVPYDVSIDIRDTVDYKQVMQQHNLGPNGAIMTSLNLYATKFDQVIGILESRADKNTMAEYLLVDTPGQIEAFTWSASGQILTEGFASTFPTVMVFVVDTVRCASSPNTFMSNMLYACSIHYRTRLPLVIAFNKSDVVSHEFALEWMKDYDAFQEALDNARSNDSTGSTGFYDSLTRSLSLVLDEFYRQFSKNACGVSAVTGDGISDFWQIIQNAATADFEEYLEDIKYRIEEQEAKKKAISRAEVRRMQQDMQGGE